jgi:hypothetical protein
MFGKHGKSPAAPIPFFPAGLPDETIGSRVSRYHIRRGKPTTATTFRQLFDRSPFSLTNLIQPHLEALAARLPGSQAQNLAHLQAESTLLPLYQRFFGSTWDARKRKQKKDACVALALRINGDSRLTHICRQCLIEDECEHGFPYIHRAHQIPGVTACWKHATKLLDRCPSCRQPFAQPTQLVLSAWLGCDCGHSLSTVVESKTAEPSEIEVNFARFTRELLMAEPINLRLGELVGMYKTRATEVGFGWGRDRVKRKALFESVEIFFGRELLATIDSAYRLDRISGWLKVLESSAFTEAPLHRHLLFAYFLFREPNLFMHKCREIVEARAGRHASLTSDGARGEDSELKETPEVLLGQMVAVAQRHGYDSQQLWKFYSGGMKRLVKIVPDACELIDARLRAAAAKKKRRSGKESEMKERDKKADIEWAKAINEIARIIYASDERPYRVTMNKLINAAEFCPKGVRFPSKARFPLARAAAEENAESVWHFFARRMLWTLQSLHEPSCSLSVIRSLSKLECHKGKAILEYFLDVPRCGGASAKEINSVLTTRGISRDWSGPCPDRVFYRAGRGYQRRTTP